MAGPSVFFEPKDTYPKPLIEIQGKTMIECAIESLSSLTEDKKFTFIVNDCDARKFHLDSVLRLLVGDEAVVFKQSSSTKGAACTLLLAIDELNNDDPLFIANSDQVFNFNLTEAKEYFTEKNADAGVVCFESVHPRWSYAAIESGSTRVIEVSEKRPISKNAIAGIYYFKRSKDFIEMAMRTIRKDASINGQFYVAPTLNEMILDHKAVEMFKVPNESYHSLYTREKLKSYQDSLERKKELF